MAAASLLAASLALASAAPSEGIDVSVYHHEVQLLLDLGREVQPYGSPEGGATGLVRSQPSWPWRCWISDVAELSCKAPRAAVQAATPFTIELAATLYGRDGAPLPPLRWSADTGAPEIDFNTRWRGDQPQLVAVANQPIDAASLQTALRLVPAAGVAEGARIEVSALPADLRSESEQDSRREHTALLLQLRNAPPGAEYTLQLDAGVRSLEGPLAGAAGQSGTLRIPGPLAVDIECGNFWEHLKPPCRPDQVARLRFHGRPHAETLAATLAAVRAAGLQTTGELNSSSMGQFGPPILELHLDGQRALTDYRIDLPPLRAADSAFDGPPANVRWSTTAFPPRLRFETTATLAPQSPRLEIVGQRGVQYRQDWWDADGREHTRQTRATRWRTPADPVALTLPKAPRDLAEQGGIEVFRAHADSGSDHATRLHAPFALHGLHDTVHAWAWLTEWQDGQPLAGARVDLVEQTADGLRPLPGSEALSDARGLARIPQRLPQRWSNAGTRTWLRARDGQRTVYLPLALLESLGEGEGEGSIWSQGALRAFVLSDQPLYAPGERVRFHAWLRRRDGMHLRAEQLPREVAIGLAAAWSWDTPTPEQRFAVSPDGQVSGELRLPDSAANDIWSWVLVDENDETIETDSQFQVSRSEPLTLDVDFKDPPARLRPGEPAELTIGAEYFGGGAAAGISIGGYGIARPGGAAEVFADWPDFQFANASLDPQQPEDCADGASDRGRTVDLEDTLSDAAGRVQRRVLASLPCAFGVLEIAAHATLPALGAAHGPTRRIPLLADREHLGLRIQPADGDALAVQAVLLDGDARVRAGAARLPLRLERWRDGEWRPEAGCELHPDGVDACRVAAGGSLRVHASHHGREHRVEHWDWRSRPAQAAALEAQWSADGQRLRVRASPLPAPAGSALLSIEQGTLVDARLLRWQGGVLEGEWARADLPPGSFDLGVLLAPGVDDGRRAAPMRLRTRVGSAAQAAADWLRIEAADDGAEPGRHQRIRLHNAGGEPLDLALTVVDAGLAALAAAIDAERDPRAGQWALALQDFDTLESFSVARPGDGRVAMALLRGGTLRRVDALGGDEDADSAQMESVSVTGSRINAEDVYEATTRSQPGARGRTDAYTLADALKPYAGALRRRFANLAHWQSGLRLAAGETQEIALTLPDNLTAWRVEAVAFAPSGHAERQLLSLHATRPLEMRPSLPAVSIAGDRLQASAGVRNATDAAQAVDAGLHLYGPGLASSRQQSLRLPARGSAGLDLLALAATPGRVQVLAAGQAGAARDAALVEALVAAPTRLRTASDAWWLAPGASQQVDLSRHQGAHALTLRVGADALPMLDVFAQRMRDYPHRCHEQIVSRAYAAALLRAARPAQSPWAEDAVIAAAWRERAGLLDYDDLPIYFDPEQERADDFLPAYVASAAQRLVALGYPAAALNGELRKRMDDHLGAAARRALARGDLNRAALNLEALRLLDEADTDLESRWWQALAQFPPLAVAIALDMLTATPDAEREAALLARVDAWTAGRPAVPPLEVAASAAFTDRSMLGHCRLSAALAARPALVDRARRWYAGVASQYGDAVGDDSLALAACIEAGLRLASVTATTGKAQVEVEHGGARHALALDAAHASASLALAPKAGATLSLRSDTGLYAAIDVQRIVDARQEPAQSIGASLTRTVEVRRGDRWEPAPARLKRGDWVRVRLVLEAPRAFDMLVLEEAVPGALRPVDTTLEAVADPWIRSQDEQDPWFHTRQLGQPTTRFYATWLPPGQHRFGYVAEVRHAGDYAWLPATLQPMYGRVQRAQTAATRLRVDP